MRRDMCRCKQWIALNRGQRPSLPVPQVSALVSSALTAAVSVSPAEPRSSVGCIELVVRCVTPLRHTKDKQRTRRVHYVQPPAKAYAAAYIAHDLFLFSHFDSYSTEHVLYSFSNTYHKHTYMHVYSTYVYSIYI
ncbi:hypothetical protein ALC56_05076 [Trachymyrmex septentrionalis]|uniref:Uncharacterized protein n=1 Tax=Trachymyrmex septentrionalis TaxID=34720 RepID=A0A195FIA2_9HYME|nr:hypothetical protein ALC56_05076 [Trachymyrmex septentrionalis]